MISYDTLNIGFDWDPSSAAARLPAAPTAVMFDTNWDAHQIGAMTATSRSTTMVRSLPVVRSAVSIGADRNTATTSKTCWNT